MNLLLIAPGCAPNEAGFSLRVYNWVEMIKKGVRIFFLSTHQQKNPGNVDHFYCHPFADSFKSKILKLKNYYKTDFENIKIDFKPDIVQIHSPYFFGLKKLFPDTPCILVEHNVYWNFLKHDMTAGPGIKRLPLRFPVVPWLQWRAKKEEKSYLRKAEHTIVCSQTDRNEILKELPNLHNKITVIPNCLDLSSYPLSQVLGESILFMGSLTYSANRDAVDIICQKIAPKFPNIPFQILGSGKYPKAHPDNVHFLGHVKDIRPFLSNCRIFIVPLRFGSGTRWKILEAFAMQRPVLSTPKGAEGLEVSHGENIWIEENWDLFNKAIEELLENRQLANRLAQNGRRLVEGRYDYPNYSSKVLEIYESLVKNNGKKN